MKLDKSATIGMEQINLKKEQLLSILEGKQKQDKHELVIQVEE